MLGCVRPPQEDRRLAVCDLRDKSGKNGESLSSDAEVQLSLRPSRPSWSGPPLTTEIRRRKTSSLRLTPHFLCRSHFSSNTKHTLSSSHPSLFISLTLLPCSSPHHLCFCMLADLSHDKDLGERSWKTKSCHLWIFTSSCFILNANLLYVVQLTSH